MEDDEEDDEEAEREPEPALRGACSGLTECFTLAKVKLGQSNVRLRQLMRIQTFDWFNMVIMVDETVTNFNYAIHGFLVGNVVHITIVSFIHMHQKYWKSKLDLYV
jgi:hypothetical protein